MVDDEEEEPAKKKRDDDGEEEVSEPEDDEEEEKTSKNKRKKAPAKADKPSKKAKKEKGEEPHSDAGVHIEMNQHVALTFSLKYLNNFIKSAGLSDTVQLMMSNDVPLLVSYHFKTGFIRYYLAPKIGDD